MALYADELANITNKLKQTALSGSGWQPGMLTTTDGMTYDVPSAPMAAPVAPNSFSYTPAGELDPAMVKYFQDAVDYNRTHGSGYAGSSGGVNVGGWAIDPVVSPNVSTYGDGGDNQQFTGINVTRSGRWQPGQTAWGYSPEGKFLSDFKPDDPNKTDWGERATLALIAMMSGGAAGAAMGGAGAGTAAGTAGGMGGVAEAGFGAGMGAAGGTAGAGLGVTAGGVAGGVGDATAAGYGGLDAASTATMGGGASGSWGGGLGLPADAFGGVGAGGLAGETIGKAALDGTNVFGANSAPGALDITELVNAAPGTASADALGKITQGLGYTPPAVGGGGGSTPTGAKSSLSPSATDLGKLAIAGAGLVGGGSAGDGGAGDLQDAETKRQAKVQAAVDAINRQFGNGNDAAKSARERMYADLSKAVRDTAMRDVDRQYGKASKANTFGLARSGLLGGSVDAESGGELQGLYGEGRLKAEQAGLGAASDLRMSDEKSRQNLISLAQTGLDTGTAASMAAGQMASAAESAKAQASGATVGRLFDDLSQAYVTNQTLKARYPNGLPQQPGTYSSNLFSPSRYTGTAGR